jgi:hypothetical protein
MSGFCSQTLFRVPPCQFHAVGFQKFPVCIQYVGKSQRCLNHGDGSFFPANPGVATDLGWAILMTLAFISVAEE